MPRLAQVVSQTIQSLKPEVLSERLFGGRLDSWWQEYVEHLEETSYQGGVQTAFFITTFCALGRMAKIDGQVKETKINLANSVMDHLKLDASQKKLAIRLFNDGKQSDFNLDTVLNRFNRLCKHRVSVLQVFIEIQCQMAFSDGGLTEKEQALLKKMCKRLNMSESIFNRIERRVRKKNSTGQNIPRTRAAKAMNISMACSLLDVSRWSSKEEIKKAYRRLMGKYHPDKMMARNATEDEIEEATELVQDIKRAHEMLSKAKKIL